MQGEIIMHVLMVNVGMLRSKHSVTPYAFISREHVSTILDMNGLRVLAWRVAQSSTEETFVALVGVDESLDLNECIMDVCWSLDQDCIPVLNFYGEKELVGPRKADWGGEFNDEYFIKL